MSTNETLSVPLASLGKRILALLVDSLILFIPCAMLSHVVPIAGGLIVLFFYAPILESSELRATLGKYLVGIQVTDLSGNRVSLRVATVRNIVKFVAGGLLLIGFLFALFTQRRQTLHDLLSDTLVVDGKSDAPVGEAWMRGIRELFRSGSSASDAMSSSSTLSQIERLQALRDKGALTEEEFQEQKRKILSGRVG